MNASKLSLTCCLALALPLCLSGCKRDTSLVDVIENHPDEFPPPFVAITPPSAASALGLSPSPTTDDDDDPRRAAVLASARCFLVSEGPAQAGLSSYTVTYELSKDLRAEFDVIAAKVGVSLDAVKRATLELADLSIEEARLVPDPDGGCDFSESTTVEVFTRQIVVGRVALDFGVEMTLEPGVEVPITGSEVSVGVEGGWTVKSATALSGENIVIAAKPEPWRVDIETATHDLGPTPQANEYEVPGTSARVSVIRYDANGPSLTLQVNTSLNQDADARPDDWAELGQSFELTLDKRQVNLLPAPGNRAITVRWTRGPSAEDPDISVVGLELQSMVAVKG